MPNDLGEKDAHLKVPAAPVPDILSASTNPADWLQQKEQGDKLTFVAQNVGSASGIIFRPLYEVHHQRYSVYWQLLESTVSKG